MIMICLLKLILNYYWMPVWPFGKDVYRKRSCGFFPFHQG